MVFVRLSSLLSPPASLLPSVSCPLARSSFTGFSIYSPKTERFRSFFDGPIPTIDVFLVRADALQALPPLRLLLSVSVSVSGEDVSAASFRSQKQPDHHPRDHSSHLWNDRNGVARIT